MNRNKLLIFLISLLAVAAFFLFSQTLAAEPPLKSTEQYLVELRDYLDKIDQESGATAKDWDNYIKKVVKQNNGVDIRISLPAQMSEQQKKDYFKSIALALLYAQNQFGLRLPSNIREFKCAPARPGTFGTTAGTPDNLTITCPAASTTNWTFTVFFHELVHIMLRHPLSTGPQHEPEVHNFIRQHIPGVLGPDNRPQNYDLFAPPRQSPAPSGTGTTGSFQPLRRF